MVTQKPIVVVGSINIDLVTTTHRIPTAGETVVGLDSQIHPGGKGANQAVAVARLGYPVRMIGKVGTDDFGVRLRTELQTAGVDVAGVGVSNGPSGVAVIVVSDDAENIIVVTPGANAMLTPANLDANIEAIRDAGIVLSQLEIPMETVEYLSQICLREGVPLILDPAPAMELDPEIFRRVTWFTPNQTEAAFYLATSNSLDPLSVAERFLSRGSEGVVLKRGGDGVYLASRDGIREGLEAFSVHSVDTTAAGDAFNGGFATALMLGYTPVESARFASAVAAISVTRKGAQPSMPNREEVERVLATYTALR